MLREKNKYFKSGKQLLRQPIIEKVTIGSNGNEKVQVIARLIMPKGAKETTEKIYMASQKSYTSLNDFLKD